MSAVRISLDQIRAARERAAGIVKVTPLDLSATFSALCQRQIHLKLENLQKTGSFKVRGALNKIQLLDEATRTRGVVTASAGNHAQGVAYAAQRAGVPVTVVMPETASFSKVTATSGYGAQVVLAGRDYSEAYAKAIELAAQQHAAFVHAFDDREVIAGQGTLGLELLEQLSDVDTVVVPVGGGGLLAGMVSALRGAGSRARIIGVQAAGASSLVPSLRSGTRVELAAVDTIADGLATRAIGAIPFDIIRSGIDDAVEVSDAEIADAVLLLLERAKTVVEGAGAVGLAACLAGRLPAPAAKVAVLITGGNIDTNLLDRIINLGLVEEGRLFRFTTRLADRPGELQRLVTCIAACRANIHQISHERAQPGLALTQASVTLELETRGREHIAEIERGLAKAGFDVDRR
ncbi:MAG: threonine ammonia-lyase [Deltaproteobacteria bacterium]|nr:threonine ammonia-lyase [Deltaproteobacteria bacterium]MBI3390707.1 threonine ammonia-lyase [Deltaproteobacteria bacterium]